MGSLGAPEIILVLVVFISLGSLILCPIWGFRAGATRAVGSTGGLLLGLFLGLLGIIIVYVLGAKKVYDPSEYFQPQSAADELQKYKQLLDSGAITEDEYNVQKSRLLNR